MAVAAGVVALAFMAARSKRNVDEQD